MPRPKPKSLKADASGIPVWCHVDEMADPNALTDYPDNPNTHPVEQLERIATIIGANGWRDAIVISKLTGRITKGHGRKAAAIMRGWAHVPIVRQDYADEAAERADVIADWKAREGASIDPKALAALIGEIPQERRTGTGFADAELLALLTPKPSGRGKAAGPREKPATGQLWSMGRHRLLCGDSLNPAHVARLLNGRKPDVTVIDPPFEIDDRWTIHIADPCIVFGQARHIRMIPEHLWRFERIIDKVKAHRSATTQMKQRHAFIAQCGTLKTLPKERKASFDSIIVCDARPNHPHEKDAELIAEHLTNWTPPGQVVFSPFAGSGADIMACESVGRTCYAIEIDVDRAHKILTRWNQSGGTPAKITK